MESALSSIRINKYIRDKGLASRREADALIEAGLVLINGKPAKTGTKVTPQDIVTVKKNPSIHHEYLAYYKPRGLATQDLKGAVSVITKWEKKGLAPVGRLDKESEGLLILTNDGRVTQRITDAKACVEKEYVVGVTQPLRKGIPAIFQNGMQTKTFGKLLPARATIISPKIIRIVLQEGKRHQIRVMLSELGFTISSLKRIRIGHIGLGDLKPGQTRPLTPLELKSLSLA